MQDGAEDGGAAADAAADGVGQRARQFVGVKDAAGHVQDSAAEQGGRRVDEPRAADPGGRRVPDGVDATIQELTTVERANRPGREKPLGAGSSGIATSFSS